MRLDQILTNLVANAFTHARGMPIEVVVEEHGDRALLTVRDAGPGSAGRGRLSHGDRREWA